MAQNKQPNLAKLAQKQQRQQRLLETMQNRERWMKWLIIGLGILVLLLILFFGYATDWGHGLKSRTTSDGTPTSSSLDALKTSNGTSTTGSQTGTGTNSTTGTTTNNTTRETSTTSTTTNNTTNNTTDASNDLLRQLYDDTGAGDSIHKLTQDAALLGVSKDCHTDILVQVCNFTSGDETITTKNLLGMDAITSITKNF